MKVITIVDAPEDLIQHWLEMVKIFNDLYPGKCKVSAVVHDAERTREQITQALLSEK